MRLFLGIVLLTLRLVLVAQTGDFILSNHIPNQASGSNINFQITADNNGLISLANRFGLLKYDGTQWDFYPTNSSALSLAIDSANQTFLGCIGEFGQMILKENEFQYEPLLKNDSIDDHFGQTFIQGKKVYFLSNKNLYSYNTVSKETDHLESGDFLNAYEFNNQIFINKNETTQKLIGDSLVPFKNNRIQWNLIKPSMEGSHLYGLDLNGKLYKFKNDKPILLSHNKKLDEAGINITKIAWVNDSLLACSTLNAGVLFFNANDTKYLKVVNYYSGLPDNEIFDLFTDQNGGTWVIHNTGLTRITPLFPAYNYSNFEGLEGNLIEAKRIGNELWVSTSLGVFFLKQDTSFNKKVSVKRVTVPKNLPRKTTAASDQSKRISEKGLFSRLFKKKSQEQINQPEKTSGFLNRVFRSNQNEIEYQRQIEKTITGVSYEFINIPNTNEKFNQLIEFKDQILATSYSGIYTIQKESAEKSISENARIAFAIPKTNYLLLVTEDGTIKTYSFKQGEWLQSSSQYLDDIILNIYSDSKNRIWLAGTSSIYKLAKESDGYKIASQIEINNRFFDELSFWENDGKIYLVNSEGIFELDEETNTIQKDQGLYKQIGKPLLHIQDLQTVWVFNGKAWFLLSNDGSIKKHHYMSVFPGLQDITFDVNQDYYWLITADNRLLSFSPNDAPLYQSPYNLFLKRLSGNNGELSIKDELILNHDENYLNIEILKPDYLGVLNPEYQYLLKGLHTEWSSWTHANLIDYTFIPPGNYELLVRARDSFGKFDEASMLQFEIKEPYWQQSWFYLVQVLILSIIIGITSKLNQDKAKNRLLKSALNILTLVVIIEFLQSVMGSYIGVQSTPVVDFLIDVSTAILVFPLEWVLRKIMLEGGMSIFKRGEAAT